MGGASPATRASSGHRLRAVSAGRGTRRSSREPLRDGGGVSGEPVGGRTWLRGAEVGGCGASGAVLRVGPGRAGGRRGAERGRPPRPGREDRCRARGERGGAGGARRGWGAGPGGGRGLGPICGAAGPGCGQRRGPKGDADQLHGAAQGHRAVPGGAARGAGGGRACEVGVSVCSAARGSGHAELGPLRRPAGGSQRLVLQPARRGHPSVPASSTARVSQDACPRAAATEVSLAAPRKQRRPLLP